MVSPYLSSNVCLGNCGAEKLKPLFEKRKLAKIFFAYVYVQQPQYRMNILNIEKKT